jgi:aryl-alcohol dehydrogenase-like predicted oxidoreductase
MKADFGTVRWHGVQGEISRLGFGCARLFGEAEMHASVRLIETALECGIRHFDTAPSYAYGQSEAVLGEALSAQAGVTVATKVGIEPSGAASQLSTFYRRYARPMLSRFPAVKSALLRGRMLTLDSDHDRPTPRRLERDAIRASVSRSLERLKRDRIDLLLLHEPDMFIIDDILRSHFEDLMSEGMIAAYGLGYGRTVDDAPVFGHVLQCRYSPDMGGRPTDARTRIFHGVLRHREAGDVSPRAAIDDVLVRYPCAAVIVSASTGNQIRRLTSRGA